MKKSKTFIEAMILFGVIAFFMFALRLWPFVFFAIGAAICSLVYVIYKEAQCYFKEAEYANGQMAVDSIPPLQHALSSYERALYDRFGRIQKGISTSIDTDYPKAIWRWESPVPFDLMEAGHSLRIVLKRANGIPKATVKLDKNGEYAGLAYYKPQKSAPIAITPTQPRTDEKEHDVDYSLLAMHWMECNQSYLVENEDAETPFISKDMLPEIQSWSAITKEMQGWGYDTSISKSGINYWVR